MDMNELLLGLAAFVLILIGILIGYLSHPTRRCKALRRTSKKNYAILRVKTKGLRLVNYIQNLDDPIYKIGDKMFNPMKNKPKIVYYEDEVPIMFYDETDVRPVRLEDGTPTAMIQEPEVIDLDKAIPKKMFGVSKDMNEAIEVSNDPTGLAAAFMSYDQSKEAEFAERLKGMKRSGDLTTLAIYVSALGVLLIGYLVYNQNNTIQEMLTIIKTLETQVAALKTIPVA
jgi:hypothetical protein